MEQLLNNAFRALNNHKVIAFPTETVYGLGVFYDDKEAYELLNKVKNRREDKPYTMMLSDIKEISRYAFIKDKYLSIINKYMPGSLTILVTANGCVPAYVSHGTGIIGIRIPSNKEALDLLKFVKKPLLVPSANKADQKPALSADEVKAIFANEVEVIIPGQISSGEPSTIIDLTGDEIKLIRKGPIPFEELSQLINQ